LSAECPEIQISDPSNAFPLEEADDYLLIAGGIGITRIRAMLHELRAGHQRVRLLYLSRDAADAAYLDELRDPELAAAIVLHQSRDSGRLDLWPYLAEPGDTHIYCCGSDALMKEVKALTFHWNPSTLHFEDFASVSATQIGDSPFTAIWEPTSQEIAVDAGTSLLDALRANEIIVDSSCNSGTCGTCRISLLRGRGTPRPRPAPRRTGRLRHALRFESTRG
jgi:phthalate 4,5-dioxygenase reductase subunit